MIKFWVLFSGLATLKVKIYIESITLTNWLNWGLKNTYFLYASRGVPCVPDIPLNRLKDMNIFHVQKSHPCIYEQCSCFYNSLFPSVRRYTGLSLGYKTSYRTFYDINGRLCFLQFFNILYYNALYYWRKLYITIFSRVFVKIFVFLP